MRRGKSLTWAARLLLLAVLAGGLSQLLPGLRAMSPPPASDPLPQSAEMPHGGWPVVARHDAQHAVQFLHNACYDVGYSNTRANPLWVAYRLHATRDNQVDKRPAKFLTDQRTSVKVVHEHYSRSGYTRGHMAPNHAIGQLCDDQAQQETFLMSNIVPQTQALNSRWWERLERVELNHFTRLFSQVWVIAGPVFAEKPVTLPQSPVQVPSHTYKIFLAQDAERLHVLAFMVDQGVKGSEPLSQYLVSVADIEAATGLSFLTALPPAQQALLKDRIDAAPWRLADVDALPSRY